VLLRTTTGKRCHLERTGNIGLPVEKGIGKRGRRLLHPLLLLLLLLLLLPMATSMMMMMMMMMTLMMMLLMMISVVEAAEEALKPKTLHLQLEW
jgi:hypothetical protein